MKHLTASVKIALKGNAKSTLKELSESYGCINTPNKNMLNIFSSWKPKLRRTKTKINQILKLAKYLIYLRPKSKL